MKNNESNYTITKTEYSPISFYSHDFMFLKIPETKIVNILKQNKKNVREPGFIPAPELGKEQKGNLFEFQSFQIKWFSFANF